MSLVKKTLAVMSMVAVSVVVRCGDDDDDDEKKEERRTMLTPGVHAQMTIRDAGVGYVAVFRPDDFAERPLQL